VTWASISEHPNFRGSSRGTTSVDAGEEAPESAAHNCRRASAWTSTPARGDVEECHEREIPVHRFRGLGQVPEAEAVGAGKGRGRLVLAPSLGPEPPRCHPNLVLSMNLKTLPPSVLVVLGLACSRTQPTVHPCLSQPYDPSTEDMGPCLSPPMEDPSDPGDDPEDDPPVGPCLSLPAPGPDDAHDSTAGVTVAAPVVASRREALERVLSRDLLPADVAARLRG
jgi:hypothetical protein